ILRQATGIEANDVFTDASGNVVYGRLTWNSSPLVWRIFFYVDLSGTETPYTFSSPVDIRFYYQQIFNPLQSGVPTYSEFAVIPSDNVTADVLDATTTVSGKVLLGTSATNVGASTSAGTANGTVANADHTHQGIHSVIAGASTFYNDLTLTASGGVVLTPGTGAIDISAPALTSSAPNDVGSAGSVGIATAAARADHTHRGVASVAKSGSSALYGSVTLSSSGGVTLTQAAQDIAIDAPALAVTAPNDIAASNQIGVGSTSARADHTHRGARSVASSGGSQLFGDIVIAGSGGASVTQASQTITVDAPALTSSAPNDVGSSAAVGTASAAARADHTHRGVASVAKSGSSALYGAVTLSASGGVTLTQALQDIAIAAPAL
ncbi:MAG: hypothetical protein EB060_12620, partial [Proteobacteria bacterium]|nr:hypothetical protein [Pseudomonadota bacterium]